MNEHELPPKALQLRRFGIGFRRIWPIAAGERSKEPALGSFRAEAEAVTGMSEMKNYYSIKFYPCLMGGST
jgi:hypothetical protein